MDDQASSRGKITEEAFRFFVAPPIWFALIVWMYPLFLVVLFVLIACVLGCPDGLGYFMLFLFFASLIFLFQSSRWFRSRVALIAPCWLFLVIACTSTTQGALTSAVTRAFSSVNSQLQKLSEIEARERQSKEHSVALEPNPQLLERARAVSKLASSCYSQGKYDESESLFLQSLALREKHAGPNDPEVAESLIGLGLVYATRRQFDKAIVAHKRALAIDEEQLGHDHPIVASDLRNLASDYKGIGNLAEYEKLIKRAIAIDGNVLKSSSLS
jgi:tetratricopeptide (TPR) repeat protein